MTYKLYDRQLFEAQTSNGQKFTFTCYSQDTRYGFRHICTLGYTNTSVCSYIKDKIIAKCSYYNRTWESFEYQTVLSQAISKLLVDEKTKEELKTILIERKELEEHEKTEEFLKDFETTWNGLNEKNKQHIRNGLGDNLIQTEEQAQIVKSVTKFMLLFQELDKK